MIMIKRNLCVADGMSDKMDKEGKRKVSVSILPLSSELEAFRVVKVGVRIMIKRYLSVTSTDGVAKRETQS